MTNPLLAGGSVVSVNGGIITSHVLSLLASAGVETLRVVDTGEVTAADLDGSALLLPEDVGHPRAASLARRLHARVSHARCDSAQPGTYTADTLLPALSGATLAMACLDTPSPALLDAVNQATLAIDLPWIIVQIDGDTGYVGPTVIPHQSPCYRCVELRRTANYRDLPPAPQTPGANGLEYGYTRAIAPLLRASVAALAALDAIRMLTRIVVPQTAGRFVRLDFCGTEMTYHRVLRFPHCPACGYGDTRPLLERWRHPPEGAAR